MLNPTAPDTTEDFEEALQQTTQTLNPSAQLESVQELKKKTVTGALSYFIRTAVLQGIGLISALLLSAFFSPEDFGVYGFVTQIIGLLIFFSDIGLAASLIQKKEKPSLQDYRTAFTVQQLLSWFIVGVAALIAASGVVQSKVGADGIWILIALSLSFPLASLKTIPSVKLERKLEFSKLVLPQILEQLCFHGVLIVLAWKGMGAIAYAWAIILRSLIGTISMYLIKPWAIGVSFNRESLKDLISFGAKFQLNDFLARIKDQLFYLVLGSFLPLQEFGYIQWSKTWSMYPYNLTVQNVMAITFPTFSRLQKKKKLLVKAIEKSIYFISLAIFPLLTGMVMFIWPLTQLVPRYDKWEIAVPSFIMFTLSIGWAAISSPLVNTLNAIGEINKSLKLMVIWTLLTWALTPLLIWQFGFNGVALSSLVISFTSGLSVYYVKKLLKVKIWKQVKTQLFASVIMALFAWLGMNRWAINVQWFLIGSVFSSIVYGISVMLISRGKVSKEIKALF